jgi:hypothetical protein
MNKAGFFYTDITPASPVYLGGYASRTSPSEGIRDPLMLRIVTLEDNRGERLVIVTADMFAFSRKLSERLREKFAPLTLILNASHTHCAPILEPHYYKPEWKVDDKYVDKLEITLEQGIATALANLQPTRIEFGITDIPFGINRRRKNKQGKVEMRPAPTRLYNAAVPVFTFYRGNKLEALLYSCNCHPTSHGGQLISADYPGAVARHLSVPALFAQGACGSAKPRFFKADDKTFFDAATPEQLDSLGIDIAIRIMQLVNSRKMQELTLKLSSYETDFELPLDMKQVPSIEDWRKIINNKQSLSFERHSAEKFLQWQLNGMLPDSCAMHLCNIKLAKHIRIITLSGEITAEAALLIQNRYPEDNALVWGHSPYTATYIPTSNMLLEGGYEALDSQHFYAYSTPFTADIDFIIQQQLKD